MEIFLIWWYLHQTVNIRCFFNRGVWLSFRRFCGVFLTSGVLIGYKPRCLAKSSPRCFVRSFLGFSTVACGQILAASWKLDKLEIIIKKKKKGTMMSNYVGCSLFMHFISKGLNIAKLCNSNQFHVIKSVINLKHFSVFFFSTNFFFVVERDSERDV